MLVRFGEWPGAPIRAGEVHLGWLRFGSARSGLEALLSADELRRASAFKFDRDQERYVIGRGSLRLMLARYIGEDPAEIVIVEGEEGKPQLASSGLAFNLSHSEDLILFAFAADRQVGVDVEAIDERPPLDDMARRVFTASERRRFESLESGDRVAFFFDTWARKEAYLKALGAGFSIPPETVGVAGDLDPIRVHDPGRSGTWSTAVVSVDDGYAAAVAVEGTGWSVRAFDVAPIVG